MCHRRPTIRNGGFGIPWAVVRVTSTLGQILALNTCPLADTTFVVSTSIIRRSEKTLMAVCLFLTSSCWPEGKNAETVTHTPIVYLVCQPQAQYKFMDDLSKKKVKLSS